jgi:hypothetical protein
MDLLRCTFEPRRRNAAWFFLVVSERLFLFLTCFLAECTYASHTGLQVFVVDGYVLQVGLERAPGSNIPMAAQKFASISK